MTFYQFFTLITGLGHWSVIIGLAIITSAILFHRRENNLVFRLWLVLAASELSVFLLKIIIARPRPSGAAGLENDFSFPSGHATLALAFYGFLAYVLIKVKLTNKIRPSLIWLGLGTLTFAIGFSRVYLGVHYPSDVFAGYLLGALWLAVGIKNRK